MAVSQVGEREVKPWPKWVMWVSLALLFVLCFGGLLWASSWFEDRWTIFTVSVLGVILGTFVLTAISMLLPKPPRRR